MDLNQKFGLPSYLSQGISPVNGVTGPQDPFAERTSSQLHLTMHSPYLAATSETTMGARQAGGQVIQQHQPQQRLVPQAGPIDFTHTSMYDAQPSYDSMGNMGGQSGSQRGMVTGVLLHHPSQHPSAGAFSQHPFAHQQQRPPQPNVQGGHPHGMPQTAFLIQNASGPVITANLSSNMGQQQLNPPNMYSGGMQQQIAHAQQNQQQAGGPNQAAVPMVVVPASNSTSFYPEHPRYAGGFIFKVFNDERTHFIQLPSQYVLVTEGSARYLNCGNAEQMAPRFVLCRHILRDRLCPRGSTCNFIHGVLRAAEGDPSYRRVEVHKNDAMETGITKYEVLSPGINMMIAYPGEDRSIPVPSQNIYKTRGSELYFRVLPTGLPPKIPQRCTHYHFKKMCHRGAECNFIHIAYDANVQGMGDQGGSQQHPPLRHALQQLHLGGPQYLHSPIHGQPGSVPHPGMSQLLGNGIAPSQQQPQLVLPSMHPSQGGLGPQHLGMGSVGHNPLIQNVQSNMAFPMPK